jgi:hypothetical protein
MKRAFAALAPMAAMTSSLVASFDIVEARYYIAVRSGVSVQGCALLRKETPIRNGLAF